MPALSTKRRPLRSSITRAVRLEPHLLEGAREPGRGQRVELAKEREHDAPGVIPALDLKLGRDGCILIAPPGWGAWRVRGPFTGSTHLVTCPRPIGRAARPDARETYRGEKEIRMKSVVYTPVRARRAIKALLLMACAFGLLAATIARSGGGQGAGKQEAGREQEAEAQARPRRSPRDRRISLSVTRSRSATRSRRRSDPELCERLELPRLSRDARVRAASEGRQRRVSG